jgi:transcriptional regulator EpsA
MIDSLDIPATTLAGLHHALRSALPIRQRSELFMWSQGALQSCVPHALLACILFDTQGQVVHHDRFYSSLIDAKTLEAAAAAKDGLAADVARHCHQRGQTLLHLDSKPAPEDAPTAATAPADLQQRCKQWALGPAMVVSTGAVPGSLSSCFVFFRLAEPAQALHLDLAAVLLPHLHVALCRSWASKEEAARRLSDEAWSLTNRQLEILNWVQQGKTNFEIALILNVSPLTVKNHLQKLFKRLDVHNRTQAVAKIMAMPGIFRKAEK